MVLTKAVHKELSGDCALVHRDGTSLDHRCFGESEESLNARDERISKEGLGSARLANRALAILLIL